MRINDKTIHDFEEIYLYINKTYLYIKWKFDSKYKFYES